MRLSCTSCTYFLYSPVVGCASGVVKESSLISWVSNPVDQILSLFEKESKRACATPRTLACSLDRLLFPFGSGALRRRWFTYVHKNRHTLILIPIANVNIASGRGEMRCRCNFYYPNNHSRPPLKDLSPRGIAQPERSNHNDV